MVSIVETTAVSLRKGDHSANLGFKGVLAEVVADLGVDGKGTDNNTTLRLHNGVTEGGIPLCRADMLNISTKILAENRQVFNDKNLAYSDLSNIDSELDSRGINTLLSNLRNAGLVTSAELENYAKKDTSNINTFSLTDPNIHNGITDIRNKPLAYADLSNVTGGLDGLERTSNKVNTITTSTTSAEKYPSTRAVVDYVEDIIIEGSDFLKKDFKNAVSYDVLYSNSSSQIYRYDNSSTNIMDGGVNFVVNTEYYTDQKLNNLEEIQVKVNSIDNNGKPTSISLTMTEGGSNPSFSNNSFIQSDTNEKCYLILTAVNVTGYANVYTFAVTIDTDQTVGTGFIANKVYTINTGSTNPPRSNKLLYVKPTLVNAGGSIESFEYVPFESNTNLTTNTLTVINPTGNAIINVISTKTLPDNIYGAKLLKTDLSNLRGMTEEDAQIAMDKAWRIGYHENLPTKDEGIDDSSYLDIATAGMVWNALYGPDSNFLDSSLSNCITEIPQNIKVELNNNTLTLKAGSILVGTGLTYTTTTIERDEITSISDSLNDGLYEVFSSANENPHNLRMLSKIASGDSNSFPTTNLDNYNVYFNTDDQKLYRYNSTTSNWQNFVNYYPVCLIEIKSGIASFARDNNNNDIIFNAACFVGHHVIIYPGIKALVANGLKENGNLISNQIATNVVIVSELDSVTKNVMLAPSNIIYKRRGYEEVNNYNDIDPSIRCDYYVKSENRMYYVNDSLTINNDNTVNLIDVIYNGTTITDFTIRQPARIVTTEILTNYESKSKDKRNIGEIITSTIPLEDAGLHLLNGDILSNEGIYSEFVTYIANLRINYPDLFTTEADWNTSNSIYGICGKFVYNSTNNTLRLPKITGFIEGTLTETNLGNITEAGLPNITGSFSKQCLMNWSDQYERGALYQGETDDSTTPQNAGGTDGGNNFTIAFDASKSNNIYGNSNTVQPQSIKVFYYIVVANTTKTDIQVNIDQIATDLNNKVDKNNFVEAQVIVETYKNGTNWYRVWSDGWIEQGGTIEVTSSQEYTVSLLKEFLSNSYIAVKNYNSSASTNALDKEVSCYDKQAGTFKTYCDTGDTNHFDWYACGYGEIPSI